MAYHYARFGAEILLTARREAVLQKVRTSMFEGKHEGFGLLHTHACTHTQMLAFFQCNCFTHQLNYCKKILTLSGKKKKSVSAVHFEPDSLLVSSTILSVTWMGCSVCVIIRPCLLQYTFFLPEGILGRYSLEGKCYLEGSLACMGTWIYVV